MLKVKSGYLPDLSFKVIKSSCPYYIGIWFIILNVRVALSQKSIFTKMQVSASLLALSDSAAPDFSSDQDFFAPVLLYNSENVTVLDNVFYIINFQLLQKVFILHTPETIRDHLNNTGFLHHH